MNLRFHPLRLISFLLAVAGCLPANGQTDADSSIQMIVIENVPFSDAIRNLAIQTGQNFTLDPRVTGKPVNIRWENITAAEALDRLLKEQGFMLIQNPATTVARIVGTNLNAKPVPADQILGDTNKTIAAVVFDYTPMEVAIGGLAKQAGLEVELDPKISMPSRDSAGKFITPPVISVRWKNISAAQALAALLDNYELVIVKDSTTGRLRVGPKERPASQPAPPATSNAPKPDK